MATAAGSLPAVSPSTVITDEQRRWVVIGICLNKLLTPVLRTVLGKEIPLWYNKLCLLPDQINKQTYKKHVSKLPHSKIKLNYGNINKNYDNHKSTCNAYDYNVKDPESLAKLFVQPFMAKFGSFDQTMDLSAVLTVMCEADPFHTSGAATQANTVRSVVRNEWAHCTFSHWTDANYCACIQEIEALVKKLNLSGADENDLVNELNNWKDKGVQLCCGQAVDDDLLKIIKTEVSELDDYVKIWREEDQDAQIQIMQKLQYVQEIFSREVQHLQESQHTMGKEIKNLKVKQESLFVNYESTSQQLEALENQVSKLAIENQKVTYLFMPPERIEWFCGRESELENLHCLLRISDDINEPKVQIASVCGLGGSGKTSLVAEYAHRWKDDYDGGVFWFSGKDEATFAKSVEEHAVLFGTLLEATPDGTLVKTLQAISRIQEPWLLVLDDMDEYQLCSNIGMLLSGTWKRRVKTSGHIMITTRRKPKVMSESIRGFKESQCLQLECFNEEDGKLFVFKRTGVSCNEETSAEASSLVEALGGLPLALEQACAYISNLSCSLSMYLEQYNQRSLRLLKEQEARPVSLYESPERLAVHTTWLLNFEYIKQSPSGKFAARFLRASAFFNPNEIQKGLINPGKPPTEDEAYRDYVLTPLGSSHILKLLTDFSLFKENRGSLSVHGLVQEVIRDNFHPDEYVSSLVDAIRFLRFAFSCSPSPDDLATTMINKHHDRASLQATDPSLFHDWHKMCLHAHEVRKFLLDFFSKSQILDRRIVIPEAARLVYECALHFNVINMAAEAKEAIDFAHKIIRLGNTSLSQYDLASLFPYEIPLPELVRRVISYSCIAPRNPKGPSSVEENDDVGQISDLKEKGNKYFKEGNFQKSVETYTSAIKLSKGRSSFDRTLLSNRASAYVRLQKFEDALEDAEDYISHRPTCWKGYARKALAMHGLRRLWDAACAAALAFYFERNIFDSFAPFKHLFLSVKNRIYICGTSNTSHVPSLLHCDSYSQNKPELPGKIFIVEPGDYVFRTRIDISDCVLIGVEDSATKRSPVLSFKGTTGMFSSGCIMATNISLAFDKGCWKSKDNSNATFLNCSFTSNADQDQQAFLSSGVDSFTNCYFKNCTEHGLRIMGRAFVEKCVFSANGSSGVQVFTHGELEIKNCKLYGNKLGIQIYREAGLCRIIDCKIFDNRHHGIGMFHCPNTNVIGNRIYQNDRHGIFLIGMSFTHIERNEIFENCWLGICTLENARCNVIKNKVYRNKYGGVQVVPVGPAPEECHSVVENNEIFDNCGPAIYDEIMFQDRPKISEEYIRKEKQFFFENREQMRKAKCKGNKEKNNGMTDHALSQNERGSLDFCSFCGQKKPLRNCAGCYSVGYCSRGCQRSDWTKKHKTVCASFLEESSVVVNVLPKQSLGKLSKGDTQVVFNHQAPGLDPKGPDYANPPKYGKQIIVKIQACDTVRLSNLDGSLFTIYDRSMTIHGDLDWRHCPLYNIVQQCGKNAHLLGWQKMFFWALLCNPDDLTTLRVFTKRFPPYQNW